MFLQRYFVAIHASSSFSGFSSLHVWVVVHDCRSSANIFRPSRAGIAPHGNAFTKAQIAETWLRTAVDLYCDFQPDESHVHLPFGHKQDVYELYTM
jgi:hypothetical protein